MIAGLAVRIASSTRGRAAVLASALAAAAVLAFSPGALAPAAARAALAAAAIAGIGILARRGTRARVPAPITVVAREHLASGSGLALVEAGGRRMLLGFGRDGVRLIAEIDAPGEGR